MPSCSILLLPEVKRITFLSVFSHLIFSEYSLGSKSWFGILWIFGFASVSAGLEVVWEGDSAIINSDTSIKYFSAVRLPVTTTCLPTRFSKLILLCFGLSFQGVASWVI